MEPKKKEYYFSRTQLALLYNKDLRGFLDWLEDWPELEHLSKPKLKRRILTYLETINVFKRFGVPPGLPPFLKEFYQTEAITKMHLHNNNEQ